MRDKMKLPIRMIITRHCLPSCRDTIWNKVIPVTDHILGTMAGGAADCSFWLRRLAAHSRLVETDTGRRLSVGSAARLLSSTLQDQRGQGLSVGTMLMGVEMRRVEDDDRLLPRDNDEECCQGVLYYIDSDGSRVKDQYFAVGSGSTFAYGILDNGFKEGLSVDDAAGLCARAVSHAAYRDAYSGGFCNIFVVNKHGWRHLRHFDQGIGSIDAQTVQ